MLKPIINCFARYRKTILKTSHWINIKSAKRIFCHACRYKTLKKGVNF